MNANLHMLVHGAVPAAQQRGIAYYLASWPPSLSRHAYTPQPPRHYLPRSSSRTNSCSLSSSARLASRCARCRRSTSTSRDCFLNAASSSADWCSSRRTSACSRPLSLRVASRSCCSCGRQWQGAGWASANGGSSAASSLTRVEAELQSEHRGASSAGRACPGPAARAQLPLTCALTSCSSCLCRSTSSSARTSLASLDLISASSWDLRVVAGSSSWINWAAGQRAD